MTRSAPASVDDDGFDPFAGAEAGIETIFRQKIAGLRRVPARQRAAAYWAARDDKLLALRRLRDDRAGYRRARWQLRRRLGRLKTPAPR